MPASVGDARAGEDERVAYAAFERVSLPASERRVPGECPPPWVVAARAEAAEVIDVREFVGDVVGFVGDVVPELVVGAVRTAFARCAVVGHEHDDRVVEVAGRGEMVEDTTDVMVGVRDERRAHFHHPGVETTAWRIDRGPFLDPRRAARQPCAFGDDPEVDLAGERRVAPCVPAVVELAAETVDPFRRRLVRCVRRGGRVPEQERSLRMRDAELS